MKKLILTLSLFAVLVFHLWAQIIPESFKTKMPFSLGELTVYPIYSEKQDNSGMLSLEESIESGGLLITEKDSGNVPRLLASSKAKQPVFLMAGEIVSGGKQDRIISRDLIILPGEKDVEVPVFCVEAGRWNVKTSGFYSEENLGTNKMRYLAQQSESNQSEIWDEVRKKSSEESVISGTSAYQDIYRSEEKQEEIENCIQKITDYLEKNPEITGLLILHENKFVSLDIFASASLAAHILPKIIKVSCAVTADFHENVEITEKMIIPFIKDTGTISLSLDQSSLNMEIWKTDYSDLAFSVSCYLGKTVHISVLPVFDTDTAEVQLNFRENIMSGQYEFNNQILQQQQ